MNLDNAVSQAREAMLADSGYAIEIAKAAGSIHALYRSFLDEGMDHEQAVQATARQWKPERKTCTIPGCGVKAVGTQGFCESHTTMWKHALSRGMTDYEAIARTAAGGGLRNAREQ